MSAIKKFTDTVKDFHVGLGKAYTETKDDKIVMLVNYNRGFLNQMFEGKRIGDQAAQVFNEARGTSQPLQKLHETPADFTPAKAINVMRDPEPINTEGCIGCTNEDIDFDALERKKESLMEDPLGLLYCCEEVIDVEAILYKMSPENREEQHMHLKAWHQHFIGEPPKDSNKRQTIIKAILREVSKRAADYFKDIEKREKLVQHLQDAKDYRAKIVEKSKQI